MKATFGPVYVEGELIWLTGKTAKYEAPAHRRTTSTRKATALTSWRRYNMGPAYFGGQFGYSSGDNDANDDKDKTGPVSTTSWVPCLIFGNANLRSWQYNATHNGGAERRSLHHQQDRTSCSSTVLAGSTRRRR